MMIGSLIAKVIGAYRRACEECFHLLTHESAVRGARVAVGAYRLDQEDEQKLKVEIMSIELRRTRVLVSKLQDRYSQAHGELEIGVHNALRSLLSSRLEDAFKILLRR